MIELEDITLREYFELEDKTKYDFAMKYTKSIFNEPLDLFNSGDFTELSFGLIKDLQFDLSQGLTWVKLIDYIEKISGKTAKQIAGYKLTVISRYRAYIESEINRINEIESELLSYQPTSDEQNAGIEDFNKFGSYGQQRKLATTFMKSPEEIRQWKYDLCLLELYYQKTNYDFQDRLFKIRNKKY